MALLAVPGTAKKSNTRLRINDNHEFRLLPHQIMHFDHIISILKKHPYAVDTSEMGLERLMLVVC